MASDIANLKAGLAAAGSREGFITSLSPGSCARIANSTTRREEEHIWAWADVMREEYKAIVDAGLMLQIDDPSIAENFDQINPEPAIEDYRTFTRVRVEASTTRCAACRRSRSGSTCAGVPGTARTPPTSSSGTSST